MIAIAQTYVQTWSEQAKADGFDTIRIFSRNDVLFAVYGNQSNDYKAWHTALIAQVIENWIYDLLEDEEDNENFDALLNQKAEEMISEQEFAHIIDIYINE